MNTGKEHLKNIVKLQKSGISAGICSVCSANEFVLEAAIEFAKDNDSFVLTEATANQVNQFGGYTGMRPADFRQYVFDIADSVGIDKERVILGGDHLGPVVWKQESEESAMAKAEILISEYVSAGFDKIHIDTSMRLSGDDKTKPLSYQVIARRAARLCAAAEKASKEPPLYVIGSEVPVPGGAESAEEKLAVTTPEDLSRTMSAFEKAFTDIGLRDVFSRVIAVVVQPGVEFSDDAVHEYNSDNAAALTGRLKEYRDIVFEGHSTDYQTYESLKAMVRDGIAILKVGPELTFALREALYALSTILKEVNAFSEPGFIEALENAMLSNNSYWKKYYAGNDNELKVKRKYSYSDRSRYYYSDSEVQDSIRNLLEGINSLRIPLPMISQYLPVQYSQIRNGQLKNEAGCIIKSKIKEVLSKYYTSVHAHMK